MTKSISTPKLTVIFLFFLCIIILILGAGVGYILYTDSLPTSSLTAIGSAKKEIVPDTALLTITVEKKGEGGNAEIDTITNTISSVLQDEFSIPQNDIKSQKNVYQNRSYSSEIQEPVTQQVASVSFEITIKDIQGQKTKPNDIISKVTTLSPLSYSYVNYTIENKEEVCQELELESLEDGRKRAIKQVDALGGDDIISSEVFVENSCQNQFGIPYYALERGSSPASTGEQRNPINLGSQTLEVQTRIEVTYR